MRDWQNILACSALGQILVVCTAPGTRRTVRLGDQITVRYYGGEDVWLLPDALVRRFSASLRRAYSWLSRPIGEALLCREVRRDLRSFDPTVAVFEEYKCAGLLPSLRGLSVPIVYDAHNVEAVLQRSFAGGRPGAAARIRRAGRAVLKREARLANSADQIWVCSGIEKGHAAQYLRPNTDIRVVPNTIDSPHYAKAYAENCGSPTDNALNLVFCGSFCYPPNEDAADLLIREIFPKISDVLPAARLTLLGRDPTARMIKAAGEDSRISITGTVHDPAEYLSRSQICLVPLRRGGGTRLKVLEAFASGCAVVSTRKGAEGLSVTEGKHLLFAETTEDFAVATKRLWQDAALRKEIIGQARDLVSAQYSSESARRHLEHAIRELVTTKDRRRTN